MDGFTDPSPGENPLVAEAGGPYVGDEGTPITLDASGSTHFGEVQYRWDFDSDGNWDTLWSTDPIATHVWVDDWTGMATVEVTDGSTSSMDTASVTVNNVSPTLHAIGGNLVAVRGQPLSYEAMFNDSGTLDTHTAIFNWGDGTSSTGVVEESGGSGTASGGHTFTESGTYTILLTVTDKDGGAGTATASVSVGVAQVEGTTLFVGGSEGRDKIDLHKGKDPGTILVSINEMDNEIKYKNTFGQGIDRIVVFGQGGDDWIKLHDDLGAYFTEIYGGWGNDRLEAGRGNAYLYGDLGDDMLFGGNGRNILIGGDGKDQLNAGQDEDILIGALYADAANREAVVALMAEWSKTDPYADRVARLSTGVALGNFKLALTTVSDDGDEDMLTGLGGLDWFFAHLGEKNDWKSGEVLIEI
jgi:hypothetical protein